MMKNKIICLFLVTSLLIGISLLKKGKEHKQYVYLSMGDFIVSTEGSYSDLVYEYNKDKIDCYNKFLSRKSMTSSDLLRLLSVDVSIVFDGVNKRISDVIKDSSLITISVGYNDVMNNVRYNSVTNKYSYDENVISRIVSMLQENIFNIVEVIHGYNNDINVIVTSIYYPHIYVDNSDEYLYERINKAIESACIDSKAKYVDIGMVSNIDYIDKGNVFPNQLGNEVIYNEVNSYIW